MSDPSTASVTETGFVSASGGDRSFTPPFGEGPLQKHKTHAISIKRLKAII
jgi:hypothetical protein